MQQPFGHVFASQLHVPFVVSHRPLGHEAQAAPPVPHWPGDSDAQATQVLPSQQPCGHEVESHTHWPVDLLHSVPDGQLAHVAPLWPHDPLDSEAYASHVPVAPPLQQPLGQEFPSHTQCPVESHSLPDPQAAQATPAAPQELLFSLATGTHDVPLQQPPHEPPPQLHEPFEQLSPLPHGAHVAPLVPHDVPDCAEYGSQVPVVPPLQQPFAHEVASHTHWPLALHSSPVAHAAHLAPPAPHVPLDCAPYAVHVPLAPPEQQPPEQVFASHAHVPLVVSHSPFEHDAQAAPPVPQADAVCAE